MATGYSSIPSQLSHGGLGDVAAMKGVWHTVRPAQEPWEENFMVHRGTLSVIRVTNDDGQSDGQAAVLRQHVEDYVGDDADINMERGLTAVSWRADVTILLICL